MEQEAKEQVRRDAEHESPNRHDIIEMGAGDYISVNRPRDAPPLTQDERAAFRALMFALTDPWKQLRRCPFCGHPQSGDDRCLKCGRA